MTKNVALGELKTHLSEYVSQSEHRHERFIITKRNKPVAALVHIDELRAIETKEEQQGLVSVIGKWEGFEEIAEAIGDLTVLRSKGGEGRDVSL